MFKNNKKNIVIKINVVKIRGGGRDNIAIGPIRTKYVVKETLTSLKYSNGLIKVLCQFYIS